MKEFLEEREALIKENAKLRKDFADLERMWKDSNADLKRANQNARFGRKCFSIVGNMAQLRDLTGLWTELCLREANVLIHAYEEEVVRRSAQGVETPYTTSAAKLHDNREGQP